MASSTSPFFPLSFPHCSISRKCKKNSNFVISDGKVRNPSLACSASKKKLGFMDQILDYIEGGPKLRKWYGAPDTLSKDRPLNLEGEASDENQVRDAVLVMDGDNEIGQMIILSLIVKRTRVKVLVKDKKAAREAFGTYVEPIAGDAKNQSCLKTALKGVRAVIFSSVCISLFQGRFGTWRGSASNIHSWNGLQHVILLSQLYAYRGASGIQALISSNARKLAEQDERAVLASGTPYTIIRTGSLTNVPGGQQGFSFEEGSAGRGKLSKEDAAFLCVEALDAVPQTGLVFEVVNGREKVLDWRKCFAGLMEKSVKQAL